LFADSLANTVREFQLSDGQETRTFGGGLLSSADGTATSGHFNKPAGLVWTSEEALLVAEQGSNWIRVVDWTSSDGKIGTENLLWWLFLFLGQQLDDKDPPHPAQTFHIMSCVSDRP
jgi:hypothetical protein